ncbi:MAG: O-antigen polymerase [Xenococcaceae cyanobacterium MO_188.B29]|nr:O-antigen polymerase [Xenococcaceae cyanobacterium MO_188.B29]
MIENISMMALAYIGLILFIVFFELTRPKDTKFDFLSLFHLFFILMYPIPGLSFTLTKLFTNISPILISGKLISNHSLQIPLSIFVTYFLVVIGFYSSSAEKYGNKIILQSRNSQVIYWLAFFLLALSFLSTAVYSSQYGGFLNAISQNNLIRAGAVEGGAFVFVMRFLYIAFFAAYLFASLLFIKKAQKDKTQLLILFGFSFILAFFASIMVGARATMIMAFINFYLTYLLYKRKFALPIIIPGLIFAFLFIIYGKSFFYSLSGLSQGYVEVINRFQTAVATSENNGLVLNKFINIFNYSFESLYAAFNHPNQIRLFSDWYYGFASFLPDRLIDLEIPPTISIYNTQYLVGHNEYNIPPGFIAACIYSWSWIGIILFSFSYGWIGRYLQTINQNHLYKIDWIPFVYVAIAQAWADFFASGDTTIFLHTNFWILFSVFCLLFFCTKYSFND